jgi:amino acid adenylation domain-containing protein
MTNKAIAEFVSHLKSLDVQLFVEGIFEGEQNTSSDQIRLRCNAPEGTLTAELRQELAERKAELVLYLHQEAEGRSRQAEDGGWGTEKNESPFPLAHSRIPTHAHSRLPSPLSFAQQRLWFLYQLAPDNPFYNVPTAIHLKGRLNCAALERSLQEIVRRHDALRTRFTTVDGEPVQIVESGVSVDLSKVNLQTVAVSDRERVSQQLATAEAQRPFNLTTDALLRVTLLQFDPTESVLLLTMHHIVADGWSLGVLIRELACFYTALVEGKLPSLPPLPIQYTDFACWQRDWLKGELEEQLAYWRKQLHDLPEVELPHDRPRPAVQTYRGATYPLQISPTLTQSLEALSQQSGASLFMVLLAAFQTLLYRYTGQEDIAIGSPIANRHRSELEGLIGFFVNSLVLRSDLSGNPTFCELLERVRNVALEAYEHQDLPFEKLVEELDPERDLSRNPLFQIAFALQNAPMQPLKLPGLTLEPAALESGSTRFDLEVHLWEPAHGLHSLWRSQEGLSGFVSYSTDLFDRDRIGRLVGHFHTLLEGIVANPAARLSDLPLLPTTEYQQIVNAWNRLPASFSGREKTECTVFSQENLGESTQSSYFHQIFEAQVQRDPEAIAVISDSTSLTYAELNQKADRLAQTLQQMGVQPDSLVGLCVDRSADVIIGILGILKAGGAYVPLDPGYPSDRLQFMLTDTQVSILLTQSWLVDSLPASHERQRAQIVCLDQALYPHHSAERSRQSPKVPCSELPRTHQSLQSAKAAIFGNLEPLGISAQTRNCSVSDSLAYVIYTSGSTGIPKGVLLTHRGLCNVVKAQQQVFHLSHRSRVLQFSSLSFDASIFEIALAFGSGGTLYIPPESAQLPGMALVQFLQENAITHALITPAALAVLPFAELPDLQVLITGGEACSSHVVDRWTANRHFFNAYGPTETTIWATVAELHSGNDPLTIGRPILNIQVYILDAHFNPVPIGIPGELYIGGEGIARGYLNRPELTAERFISFESSGLSSKSTEVSNSKLYKTGDRALYHPDGTIQFLGRIDHQIKIRGFRVELGEIEAALQRHPAVREAVVIPSSEPPSEKRLIAYFSLNIQHLQQTLLQSIQAQHIQHWQALYNQTYQSPPSPLSSPSSPPLLNTTGWNSSYTGDSIPLEEMQEWVGDRVQQILALNPQRVLEIGCGTGLLLFQIAPHCEKYVGTDFSAVSLESIQHQLGRLHLRQVELLHRMATDFEGVAPASFDVVILNSIVQYFPSADYLLQVLEGAIQAVAPGGVLFVGDVRSLPLLTAFHAWVQFCQADASLEREQLQRQVERSQFEEPELAIAPPFFHRLRDQFPQIQQVQIRLSRGRSQNEMTQFRYNVLLYTEQVIEPCVQSIQKHDWKLNPITVEETKNNLIEAESKIVIITNVTNSRVDAAVRVANWLRNPTSPKTVGRMREILQNSLELADHRSTPPSGIAPQDWWDIETVLPYDVEITWSTQTHTGDYDVLLIRHETEAKTEAKTEARTEARIDLPEQFDQSCNFYTNHPLQSSFARQLIPELRQYLRQSLPEYMIPSAFVPLGILPTTSSGKVDRLALSTFKQDSTRLLSSPIAPSTQAESALIEIWKDLLRLKQVSIHDNFFELGGHSLLATQMTSRIRDVFGLELPLKSVFEAPTIAQLAPILETLRDTSTSKPPLVRLDRSAHRRKRSPSHPSNSQVLQDSKTDQSVTNVTNVTNVTPVTHTNSWSPLIPLTLATNTGETKPPFFCIHPMFGVVFPYLELAHHLSSAAAQFPGWGNRSFYGLQPLGLDGRSSPLNRIEAIATYYIQAIQTLQPHGPYFLGGWSFGGLVAFEMAQQLTQAGQQIGLLAILDTTAPCNKPSPYQSLKFLAGTALRSTLPFLLDYGAILTNRLQFQNPWFRWQWSAIARLIPEESRLRLLDESTIKSLLPIVYANSQATYRYVPQPYPNRVTLFKAATQVSSVEPDSALGWSALARDIQLHQVPGNHLSLLKQPHVQTLAQQLGQCLL